MTREMKHIIEKKGLVVVKVPDDFIVFVTSLNPEAFLLDKVDHALALLGSIKLDPIGVNCLYYTENKMLIVINNKVLTTADEHHLKEGIEGICK